MTLRRPVRLLLVVPTMGYGGTERQILELLQNIDSRRFEVTLLIIKEAPGYLDQNAPLPCQQIHLKLSHCYNLWQLPSFLRVLRQGQFTLIHAWLPVANFWCALARLFLSFPVLIGSSRNVNYPPPRWLFRWADLYSFRYACDLILSNSQEGKSKLSALFGIPPHKIQVILNGRDFSELQRSHSEQIAIRNMLNIPQNHRVVMTVGRLMEQKGIPEFLAMAARLRELNHALTFLIVGDGPDRPSLEIQAARLGLSHQLRFLGFRRDAVDLLKAADVFVLASLYEGCPNALLEALAMGIPSVASDIAPHREFLDNEVHAILVRTGDPETLAAAVQRLLEDHILADRISSEGQRRVRERYALARMVSEYENLYTSLTDGMDRRPIH